MNSHCQRKGTKYKPGGYVRNPDNVKNPYKLIPAGMIVRQRKGVSYPYNDGIYVVVKNDLNSVSLKKSTRSKSNLRMNKSQLFQQEHK